MGRFGPKRMAVSATIEAELVSDADRDGAHRLVVGAVVANEGCVLLLKRRRDDFMGGIYELPSGRVEAGETLSQALRREVEEETGLEIKEIKGFVNSFDYESSSGALTRQFNFNVSLAMDRDVALSEHEAFCWAGLADLGELPMTESTRGTVKQYFESPGD